MLSVVNASSFRPHVRLRLPSAAALASRDWKGVSDEVSVRAGDVVIGGSPETTTLALLHFKNMHLLFKKERSVHHAVRSK